jgi:hypothetical protein
MELVQENNLGIVFEKGNKTLYIFQDNFPVSPREWNDNLSNMISFHKRYSFSDKEYIGINDPDVFLFGLLEDTIGDTVQAKRFMQETYNEELGYDYEKEDFRKGNRMEYHNKLLDKIREKYVIEYFYLYDHSGLSISLKPFSCPWDSGEVGFAFAKKQDILNEFGRKRFTDSLYEKTLNIFADEIKEYDHYLQGNCFKYQLFENKEEIESEYNFLGYEEDVIKQIKEGIGW